MEHRRCGSLHRFCPTREYDAESSLVDEAIATLRAAAHRTSGKKRTVVASVQCDLASEPQPTSPASPVAHGAPVTHGAPVAKPPKEPESRKGELNINGTVLLASDWDLIDDDVRFAHYPLLDLQCCGARERHKQFSARQENRSLPRPLRRVQLQVLQQELQHQRLQRIPKHREAFPVLASEVDPEANDDLKNRIRQTYDHAHSHPLHIDDSYLKLHMKSKQRNRRPTPGRFGHRLCCHPEVARPLYVEAPVCACPHVIPPPQSCCICTCSHCSAQPRWSAQPPQAPADACASHEQPGTVHGGTIPLSCGSQPVVISSSDPRAGYGSYYPTFPMDARFRPPIEAPAASVGFQLQSGASF